MPSVGTVLEGRYEILAQLAEGSFGQVYKGRQRSTGQAVAIKMLRLWHGQAAEAVENQAEESEESEESEE